MLLELILLMALHDKQGIDLALQAANGKEQFFVLGGGHGLHRRNDECEERDLFGGWLGHGHGGSPSIGHEFTDLEISYHAEPMYCNFRMSYCDDTKFTPPDRYAFVRFIVVNASWNRNVMTLFS